MTHPVRIPLWLFVLFFVASALTAGAFDWQWHKQRREAAIYKEALEEARVRCVRARDGSEVLLCATDKGDVFAVGFSEPVHSEGDN